MLQRMTSLTLFKNFFIAGLTDVRRVAANYAFAILGAVGVQYKESKRCPTGQGHVHGRSNMGEPEVIDILGRLVVKKVQSAS